MAESLTLFRKKSREDKSSDGGPSFFLEEALHLSPVCGIDEAGRGPLAGPVVAAAVVLTRDNYPEGINDSKKLTEAKRERIYEQLLECAEVGVGLSSVEEIDEINILQASLLAMSRAYEALPGTAKFALIDGIHAPKINVPTRTIKRGDSRSLSIAAASIIAKVTRDRLMCALALDNPEYDWASNKGYGSANHLLALRTHGAAPQHRKTFAPVKAVL